MMPTAITFADDKMQHLAKDQAENFQSFGVQHEIIHLSNVENYGTSLWLQFLDLTAAGIRKHGKIFRVDSEVRLHQSLPSSWIEHENVLFEHWPLIKDPWYCPINTGHMILSNSGLGFVETLKECMLAMIPPDGDTLMPGSGEGHYIDDEWPSAIAIRLSKIQYLREQLKQDRRDAQQCAASRGTWVESSTILTHPAIHNWNWIGGGPNSKFSEISSTFFINHFDGDLKLAMFIEKLMLAKNDTHAIWKKISDPLEDGLFSSNGWIFDPRRGLCAPIEHWDNFKKSMF